MKINLKQKLKKFGPKYRSDCTALVLASTPLLAGFEVFVAKIPIQNSINTRLIGAAATYAGFGSLYLGLRDYSRKRFNVHDKSGEAKINTHDTLYGIAYSLVASPFFLFSCWSKRPRTNNVGNNSHNRTCSIY